MSVPIGPSLTDFIAYELPSEKWMKSFSPRMRLRVRGKKRNFVSSVVKVDSRRSDARTNTTCIHWLWGTDERPSFADDEMFEIVIERRFLLRYKCIRRTKSVTVDQFRTSDCDPCTLSLYDGQHSIEELEDKIEIGKITFKSSWAGADSSENKS